MTQERWFRDAEAAAFDWRRSAQDLDVPVEVARALYLRAIQRAADDGAAQAEAMFLRWLRAASVAKRAAAKPSTSPGRNQKQRERRELAALGPGKWTRALLDERAAEELRDALLPSLDSANLAMDALVAGPNAAPVENKSESKTESKAEEKPAAAKSPVDVLRDRLIAAVQAGQNVAEVLALFEPTTAVAALHSLRGERTPTSQTSMLRLVTTAADGEVERVLGHGHSGAALPDGLAGKLGPHLGHGAVDAARIHTGDHAELVTEAHHARALTVGRDIYFGRGEYNPGTAEGDELIAHEIAHVAQGQRGELTRAAAKGIDGGNRLEPGEAEADLRARLAVIQIHAPTGAAPTLASPTGQPTSTGDRVAKINAQKKRIDDAGKASQPLDVGAPPARANPQAPVAHTAAPIPAPQAPASSGNAYVDTFSAPPSKQALELWDATAGKATTQATADEAKFNASLPPMPAVLDGSAAPGKAGGGGGGAKAPAPSPVKGATPPAATAQPTPPAPQVTAGATAARNYKPVADKAKMKTEGQKVLDNLPTTAPEVKTDPGPAPITDLAGQGDPVRASGDHQHAITESAKALDDAKAKVISGPGAAQVQPTQLNEKLKVPAPSAPGAMPALQPVEGMAKFKKLNLPGNAQASFDDVAKQKMDASYEQGKAKMKEADAKRDSERNKAVADAETKVKQANADADKQQQAKVAESRTKIANHQADTLVKQENEIKKLDNQSSTKKKSTISKINERVSADQTKVENDYKTAQTQAEDKKKQGEADAEKKKREAEKKKEDESWWDKAADAVCDAVQAIADEIDHALQAIGEAIGHILDAVKDAACKVIDAARDFVCQALSEFGEWLKSAVTALIGSVFPELAAALNRLIDEAVNAAKAAVNAIADGLKQAVTALCDSLKASIEAAIAAFRAAVQAAATFAKALITGDWKLVAKMILEGVLKLLGIDPGAFYALIGKAEDTIDKIVENPGAFVGHLVDAVKLGFKQFGANFLTHLKEGVVQWLFGTFAEAGITMPASFDVAGIFDLSCQVLGLTWPRLRTKVVRVIGEQNTERLEFVSGYIQALVTGGFAGLWEKVQQDMAGLWDTVIGGVKSWLMEKLIQQAIIKIATMWNPAGAIIQLIQTAWNVYQWVRENAQRIFGLVQAVVDSMANIAAGNIGGAANYIESSLAKLVPIAISLFANLLGLGGIADKIRSVIEKVQTKVDQAIDKLIDRVLKMFKGKGGKDKDKDKDKDGKGKDGTGADGKDGKDKDGKDKQVGTRVAFSAHGESHTQFIDPSGVPMVASVPSSVKGKIAEWQPRLRELPEADKKRAGQLIGKAIAIEKVVAGLVPQVKEGKASEQTLEGKQRELADTLAGLFEVMAPDMDPNKAFSEQDPRATLKSPQYAEFKGRFTALASSLSMPSGAAAAQDIWLKMVTTLQKTDAAYKAAPTVPNSPRKDLSAQAFTDIMKEFEPITTALKPYMDKFAHGKKSWAFWSGKPAVEAAKKHAEVCLEKSALGGLFDNININGGWDIQMWASLSKAYATHAAAHVGEAKLYGFVGMGSSADQSIFNKIEQPQFVGMLSEHQRANIHVDWYAVAGDPKTDMRVPDWRFHAGSYDGVYAMGDRGAMVAMAESENKRRLDLFKNQGIDEGPGGAGTNTSTAPIVATGAMQGESHKLTLDTKKGEIRLASVEDEALKKVNAAIAQVRNMDAPAEHKDEATKALQDIRGKLSSLQGMLSRRVNAASDKPEPAAVDQMKAKADEIMAALAAYGAKFKVHDVVELPVFDSSADYEKLAEVEGGKRIDTAITAWEGQVTGSHFKEDAVEIWAGWTLGDHAKLKTPAVAVLKQAAIASKADGAEKMRKLFTSEGDAKTNFHRAAGTPAAEQAKAYGLAKAAKPDTKTAIEKTAYVVGGDYGKIETPKSKPSADPKLQSAVAAAGGIVAFMTGMATAKAAGGMSHAEFETAWADQANVNYLKDQFRAADPGKHEWIPSNQIANVITRAHSTTELEHAAAWIELHHKLRCDTSHLIFAPSYAAETRDIDGKSWKVLCGHSGAVYLADAAGGTPSPSTFNQNIWHDELRAAFETSTSVVACIDALKVRFEKTIWDGAALPSGVYEKYVTSTGSPVDWSTLAATQKTRYQSVEQVFASCRSALARFG